MINKLLKIGVCSTLIVTGLYSASFNCKKASTFIENTICSDAELSKLDEQLAAAYKKVWHSMSDRTDLKKDQFDWLKNNRNKCTSLEELKTSYINRVLYLTNYDNTNSQVTMSNSNSIQGTYEKGSASIEINQNLSFNYSSVNERNGNLCSIEDGKFKVENTNLVWNSNEYDCKIIISNTNKNSINFNFTGNGCNAYCGSNAYIVDGLYKLTSNTKVSEEKFQTIQIYDISPYGKLADMYGFGSRHTDIQRDNMEEELKGKIVRWKLPVYEVSKDSNKTYIITTGNGDLFGKSYVQTKIEITAKNNQEVQYIESLMTGDVIKIQGKISGVNFLRMIEIEDASFF